LFSTIYLRYGRKLSMVTSYVPLHFEYNFGSKPDDFSKDSSNFVHRIQELECVEILSTVLRIHFLLNNTERIL
ncbi:unnamed protein product, partial [Ceratitis capitata]